MQDYFATISFWYQKIVLNKRVYIMVNYKPFSDFIKQ